MSSLNRPKWLLCEDGLHLNKLGYQILKSQVKKALEKHLSESD